MPRANEAPRSDVRRELKEWLGLPLAVVCLTGLCLGGYVAVGRGLPDWLQTVDAWTRRRAYPGCMSRLSAVQVGWKADDLRAHFGDELYYHDVATGPSSIGPSDSLAGRTVAAGCRLPRSVSPGGPWTSSGEHTVYLYAVDGAGAVARIDVETSLYETD
jgi:hypothetical protein